MDIIEMSLLGWYYLWLRNEKQVWSSLLLFQVGQGSSPQEAPVSLCRSLSTIGTV